MDKILGQEMKPPCRGSSAVTEIGFAYGFDADGVSRVIMELLGVTASQ